MRYNPALDGLRAVAILLVILDHAGSMPGGLIGVDVFFVLSGYLITSILLRELRETGDISLSNFYWRRAMRLFPALAILAIFELVRSLFNPHGTQIREAVLAASLYLQNFDNVFQFTHAGLMGHTWSLATEEQFYLLWPLALPLIFSRKPLVWLGAAVVVMLIARLLPIGYSRPAIDFSPGLRPIGLWIGCAIAFRPIRAPKWVALPAVASLFIVAAIEEHAVILAPLVASVITAVLIGALQWPSVLGHAALRYVGKISYGLFLYSVPILALGQKWMHGPIIIPGLVALSFVAAALSYEFVEMPFLRLKDGTPRNGLGRGGAGLGAAGRPA
jgi:peptidoglycan/LPS O-acetylase OafA/YrhL